MPKHNSMKAFVISSSPLNGTWIFIFLSNTVDCFRCTGKRMLFEDKISHAINFYSRVPLSG